MHLSVIIRSHDKSNLRGERITGTPKSEVTYRCVYSIVHSLNEAIRQKCIESEEVTLTILDDHSEHPDILKKILSSALCETRFEELAGTGNNDSLMRYFELGAAASDLVYLVEDDYLHEPPAIAEMIRAHSLFSQNTGKPIALIPFDDPDNYRPRGIVPSRIVYGPDRHWRTNDWSLCTFFLSSESLRKHWGTFASLARLYDTGAGVTEGNTFTPLWEKEIILFSPIPSLALHLQDEQHKDPYMNWREWWDRADLGKPQPILPVVRFRDQLPSLLRTLELRGIGVEVGADEGDFSSLLLEKTLLSKLYSVDSWRVFSLAEYGDIANVDEATCREKYDKASSRLSFFGERSEILWMLSSEAAGRFPDGSLDFVYIDANHSYRGCTDDLTLWWPKLKKGGVFSGHDYVPDGMYEQGEFGVQRAVREFAQREGQGINVTEEGWPSWWCVKK